MNFIKDYIETEFSYIYPKVYWHLRDAYNKLYNAEEAMYKKSDEYKKLKKKEYWNRPKSVIGEEAVQEELSKLDLWVPRQNIATQQSHITYANNATDTIDNTTPLGFKPSITINDFFKKEGVKIQKVVQHPSWVAFAKAISDLLYDDEFINSLSESSFEEPNPNFYTDYINVMTVFNIQPFFSEFTCKKVSIVTNGCKVIALRLEAGKLSEIKIDIQKHPTHVNILGCKENECFHFPGIPDTYKIKEIWK